MTTSFADAKKFKDKFEDAKKTNQVLIEKEKESKAILYSEIISKANRIGGVMVSVLASSVVDHGFKPHSGQTNYYKIGICCFSAKHAAIRRKSKYWLVQNQDNVSEWSDMSTRGLVSVR